MSQGFRVYKDHEGDFVKNIILPVGVEKEKKKFKTVSPTIYMLISTENYGSNYAKSCKGCIFTKGNSHRDGCGTLCVTDWKLIKTVGTVWKWNEKLSYSSPYNIYEQCESEDVLHMIGVLNYPIHCTKIIFGKQVYLCNEDASPYEDTTEMEICENGIIAKEGYVFRVSSDIHRTSIVIMKCIHE